MPRTCSDGGTHQAGGHRRGALPRAPGRRRGRVRHAARGRCGLAQGTLPVPRRADPLLPRPPAGGHVPLLRLWGVRGRLHVPPEDGRRHVRRGRRADGRAHRRPAALRGGREGAGPRGGGQASAAHRDAPGRGAVLPRPAAGDRGADGPGVPDRPRLRPGGRRPLQRGVCAPRLGQPAADPARPRLHDGGDHGLGPRLGGPARRLRPVPGPHHVADPRRHGPNDRLRRPEALRGRSGPQVPQHPGDAALPEVAGALRSRPREAGDLAIEAGRHRRGVHGRHGRPPVRGGPGGRDVRHRVRRGSREDRQPAAGG